MILLLSAHRLFNCLYDSLKIATSRIFIFYRLDIDKIFKLILKKSIFLLLVNYTYYGFYMG